MAEGYLKLFLEGKALVFSAGTKNHEINKYAIETMKDDGIDISTHSSNHVSEFKKKKLQAFTNPIICNCYYSSKYIFN